jgi:metallo-beta-lactamase family protein
MRTPAPFSLTFHGAAGEVTGSCYLVEAAGLRFLVDCGMFQGGQDAEAKNRRALKFGVDRIDFMLLTHAHIDHSGLIPVLVKRGFKGPIYTTSATADLLEVMLVDSAHIQEKDAEHHEGEDPLYTVAQALSSLRQLRRVEYDVEITPAAGVRVRMRDAGHILGAAIIEVWLAQGERETKLVFSGDLGQPGRPLVRDPTPVGEADVLVMESTYGNRLHKPMDATIDELCQAVTETLAERRGNIVIPAFAVGRTQELLYLLIRLVREGRLGNLDIVVDSPLAAKATAVTLKHWSVLDPDVIPVFDSAMRHGGRPRIRFTESVEESAALSRVHDGTIIIAGSGMCDAGRIKYHLRDNLPRSQSSIVIIGFQAEGTLGRRIVDGARSVRIFGDDYSVRAKVYTIGGLSAHGDQAALMGWLRAFSAPPARTFIVHGEPDTARSFGAVVQQQLKWRVDIPSRGQTVQVP